MAAEANRWLEDFEHVANLSAERQQSAARAAVGSLDQRLQAMEANPTHYRLGAREVRRRRGLMDDLKRQCGMQDTAPKVYGGGTFVRPDGGGTSRGAGAGANRDLLLEQRRMMDGGSRSWGGLVGGQPHQPRVFFELSASLFCRRHPLGVGGGTCSCFMELT